LFSELDEKFFDGLLTRVGKDFTRVYYDTDCYLEDYAAVLGDSVPTLYHVEDSWANYDKLAPVIDQLLPLEAGRASRAVRTRLN
jgi:hypothetical protein